MDPKELLLSRMSDYGNPVTTFEAVSQLLWDNWKIQLSPRNCCRVIQAIKMVRERYKHNQDNLDDLAAYKEIERMIRDKHL